MNPIVLRAGFGGDPSFAGHLATAKPGVLAAYAHQDYPFARLAERLQPQRDSGRPPVFQALFTLQKAQEAGLEALAGFALGEGGERMGWAGLELEAVRLGWRPVAFDLSLVVAETADGLRCSLQFCADLFDPTTARRLLERFAILARAAAVAPELRVGALPWLSDGERAQLLAEWNDTASAPAAEELVHRLLERQVARTPERVAVVCAEESLTYGEVNARANRMARHLLAVGLAPEGRVGVCLDRSPDLVIALLAILKAGGAYVPLDPTYPRERLALILADAGIDLLITEERRAGAFGPEVRVVRPDADCAAIRGRREDDLPRAGDLGGSLAYVIYTSGSTGRPKGVMVGHRNVTSFCVAMDHRLGEEPGCWLAATSISFDISVLELLWTLSRGYRVVIRASDSRLAAAAGGAARPIDFGLFFFAGDAGAGEGGEGGTGCCWRRRSAPTAWGSRPSGRPSGTSTPSAACTRIRRSPAPPSPPSPSGWRSAPAAWCSPCTTRSAWRRSGRWSTTSPTAGWGSPSPPAGTPRTSSSRPSDTPPARRRCWSRSRSSAGSGAARG